MSIVRRYTCASIDIGVINLALCVTEFVEECDGTFTFHLVHVERVRIGRMSETTHRLSKNLLSFYNASDALNRRKLDYVFIEQQVSRASKNTALAYVTMAYFETRSMCCTGDDDGIGVIFVSPKSKFKAVKYVFKEEVLASIDFGRRGKELKRLSVDVARLLFTTFDVEVGLRALNEHSAKLDDVSDAFLQSFAFFLEKFPSTSRSRSSFIGVEEHRKSKNAYKQA